MEDYAGRLLADRYRLPQLPAEEFELAETRAYDTASGQEVLVRQIPLPEVLDAEVVGDAPYGGGGAGAMAWAAGGRATRRPADPAVRRAVEAAKAASRLPDHPRLDQVFDVFVEGDGLWVVSELVAARPLAVLLAERPLTPHRAAEVAADLLAALRVVHSHGWTHRNITTRTVLICEDGRALLTGLAVGAAEEALCGYDPLPAPGRAPVPGEDPAPEAQELPRAALRGQLPPPPAGFIEDPGAIAVPSPRGSHGPYDERGTGLVPQQPIRQEPHRPTSEQGHQPTPEQEPRPDSELRARSVRSGAIAAYRAGAQAAMRDQGGGPHRPRSAADPSAADPPSSNRPPLYQPVEDGGRYRGPGTALAAERARQARITMVGAVTERWAPEQAGPVYENWRLAPPVGPAADLWALGALLFRAVQGHPPYPEEEGAAELVQMVCAEPPAYAEDCGALRPVIESLLRQDPTERPDFEELRGWLRSLIRSAPEPDVGRRTVTVPPALEPGAPADPRRLPVLRRRGELVRRRRREKSPVATRRRHRRSRGPRSLGRTLVTLVLAGMAAAMLYAVLFMPEADEEEGGTARPRGAETVPAESAAPTGGSGEQQSSEGAEKAPGSQRPQTTAPPGTVPEGYTLRKDPAGFRLAVPDGWERQGENDRGQVRYTGDGYELLVVPGRDTAEEFGSDPMKYQIEEEAELAPYRAADWSTLSGLREIAVGGTSLAEGAFTWRDGSGKQMFAQNRAMVRDGRYHLLLMIGPESGRDAVEKHFSKIKDSYQVSS